ncbi:ABC transporter ATP-binding protein [soil metagenome]
MLPVSILIFRFLPPLIVANILDRISAGDFTPGEVWDSFGTQILLYASLTMLGGIFLWRLAIYILWKLEMRVTRDIHQRIFAHLLHQSSDFHDNRFGGSLVSQTNKFAGSYVRLMDTVVFQLIGLLVSFLFTFVILAPRVPLIVLALFIFSSVFIAISIKMTQRVRMVNAKEASAQNKQTGYLADAISNVSAVKSFARGSYEGERFAKATDNTMNLTNELMKVTLLRELFFSSSTTNLSVLALSLAVISAVSGSADIGTVFLVVSYTSIIAENLWTFSISTLRNINRSIGDAQEMTEILQIEPSIKDPDNPQEVQIARGAITFRGVHFSYKKEQEKLFENLDLRIKPGEKIGLVGHSGGGKTTITKLIMRYVDIQKGVINIDGQDISRITQDDLRSRISYVPQEPLLFHRSLADNIRYGSLGASMKEIVAIAKLANAHEFIEKLPNAYDTLVGERGVKLSGGQRQRIAIARAMLKNAPILLLDEATSALDSNSEALIQEALWRLMENRTTIVIAHRLSTIQHMDRILVMENGSVAEEGTHNELIRKKGVYRGLWAQQSDGFMDDGDTASD